jgi:hypothetical protein
MLLDGGNGNGMAILRIIGDVHAQIGPEDLLPGKTRAHVDLIAGAPYSIQVGDMGDGESYDQLVESVDAGQHGGARPVSLELWRNHEPVPSSCFFSMAGDRVPGHFGIRRPRRGTDAGGS